MRYLLDTHTVLWSIGQSHRLSATARDIIRDRANEIAVSAVSLWEISLKYGIGKLVLGSMTPDDVPAHCESLGLRIIQLDPEDASTYHTLPRAVDHRDPFDRMLVHQCIRMRAILVTRDAPGWRATSRTAWLARGSRRGSRPRTSSPGSL